MPPLRDASHAVHRAIRRVLRPLVRFMIVRGITYPVAASLVKGLYVEVAAADFPLLHKRQTESRLSLLTGVHRSEVKRLLDSVTQDDEGTPPMASLGARLAARWISDRTFLDDYGNPLALVQHARDDAEPSFESLVASVRTDIRSRPILDEWLRLGVVELDTLGRVRLSTKAFVPRKDSDEKAFYFAQNLHDHFAVSVDNMLGERPPLLERSVYYNRLTNSSVDTLQKLSAQAGMRAIQEVNSLALQLSSLDAKRPNADRRINFGVYFFVARNENPQHREDGESGEQ
jgi:hypothetical protein